MTIFRQKNERVLNFSRSALFHFILLLIKHFISLIMNKLVCIVILGILAILAFSVDLLRNFSFHHVATAKICFLSAESRSVWTFVACALSINPATVTVQALTKRGSPGNDATSSNGYGLDDELERWEPKITLRWFAPFFSGGGYSSEAISYVSELQGMIDLSIVQHGDSYSDSFVRGLPAALRVRTWPIHFCLCSRCTVSTPSTSPQPLFFRHAHHAPAVVPASSAAAHTASREASCQ